MGHWNYWALEAGTVTLFVLTVVHAWRRGIRPLLELLTAAVYGVLLEWGDITLFGTYNYSTGWFLRLGPVPIGIGLCWALLIYSSMRYSDQLGIPRWAAPFADAIWAIVLDLAFDAVAIRLHLWQWKISLQDGYFGVPAGNFSAWLYVALGFSLWTRFARTRGRSTILQILAPAASFLILLAGIFLFDGLVWLFYPHTSGDKGMAVFVATLAVFASVVGVSVWRCGLRPRIGVDLLPLATRFTMHGYFGLWLVLWLVIPSTRLAGMNLPPLLLGMALLLLCVEIALALLVAPLKSMRQRLELRLFRRRPNIPAVRVERDPSL